MTPAESNTDSSLPPDAEPSGGTERGLRNVGDGKRNWHAEIALVISGIALAVSLVSALFEFTSYKEEVLRIKREELRSLIIRITKLEQEHMAGYSENRGVQALAGLSTLNNVQKQIYLDAAAEIVDEIPSHVTAGEYGQLGWAYQQNGNIPEAKRYYEKAVASINDPHKRSGNLRAIGVLYFIDSPIRDFDVGRSYFERAIDELGDINTPLSRYRLGRVYEIWGLNELEYGTQSIGRSHLLVARNIYVSLPPSYSSMNLLPLLDARMEQALLSRKSRESRTVRRGRVGVEH